MHGHREKSENGLLSPFCNQSGSAIASWRLGQYPNSSGGFRADLYVHFLFHCTLELSNMQKPKELYAPVNNYNNAQVVDFLQKRYEDALKSPGSGEYWRYLP